MKLKKDRDDPTYGGFMKSLPKQTKKWILSTLLFTALGSQYYYSITSNHVYSVNLSSKAGYKAGKESIEEQMIREHAEQRAKNDSDEAAAKKETQAGTGKSDSCPQCPEPLVKSVVMSLNDSLAVKTKLEKESQECADETTPLEKRQCLKKIAKVAAEEKAEARLQEFKDRVEAMADECNSKEEEALTCVSAGFSEILKSYSGKDKLEASAVAVAYNTYIEAGLRNSVTSLQQQEARIQAALLANNNIHTPASLQMYDTWLKQKATVEGVVKNLTSQVPTQYPTVRNLTMSNIEWASKYVAATVNENYKAYSQSKNKNSVEATNALIRAKTGETALLDSYNIFKVQLEENLKINGSAQNDMYFHNTFIPDMDLVLSRLSNLTGGFNKSLLEGSGADASNISAANQEANNARNGRSGVPLTTNGTTTTIGAPQVSGGVIFNPPARTLTTPPRLGTPFRP